MDDHWFKRAVFYEVPVYAFGDSNGDGIGDFGGLTKRLDYIQELGVDAIWILPFFASPLRDGGYDISDFEAVHPRYGTLEDVQEFLDAAHERGLRVISDFVVNHTSDQHSWFQEARLPNSPTRSRYVWTDDPALYHEARIIFIDTHVSNWAWDDVAGQYYWHRFFDHQPDLNYDDPWVREAIKDAVRHWLRLGFDGLRLDAVPYLFEREGTNGENLPETHEYLKELRAMVDEEFPDRVLLAEANQWPEDVVPYFGNGDECHMAFHFPVMPRIYMAVELEDASPIIGILERTPAIPANCQWGIFLRNHDELTLEMVSEEERAFMYERYAPDPKMRKNLGIRRRLAPLLGGNRAKIELLNGLLLSLPGSPIVYYGDEIGMGDEYLLDDRDGVRTPMQWDSSPGAGFSDAPAPAFYLPLVTDPEYSPDKVNVAAQESDPMSQLSWTRRMLETRRRHAALSLGTFEPQPVESAAVLCFVRRWQDEQVLVAANLSSQELTIPLPEVGGAWADVSLPEIVWSDASPLYLPPYSFRWLAPA